MLKRIEELIGTNCPDLPSLLDGLPVGVALLDEEGHVLMLNKALEALTGYNREEVRGLPCRHVLRSRACLQDCPHGREAAAGVGIETDCINRHHRKIPIRITPVRVLDGNNRPICVLDVVEELTALREIEARLSQAADHGQIVGRSPAMKKILGLVPVIAQHDTAVLITGETGTGKDLLAESVHKASPRSREPFVRFSCGPMPSELLDAELFGRMQGPDGEFKPGRFQQAQGGTLYLSEIADLPLSQQSSLVRFLDEGTILPVGAGKPLRASARLMASTAESPEKLVQTAVCGKIFFIAFQPSACTCPGSRTARKTLDFCCTISWAIMRRVSKRISAPSAQEPSAMSTPTIFRATCGNSKTSWNLPPWSATAIPFGPNTCPCI